MYKEKVLRRASQLFFLLLGLYVYLYFYYFSTQRII